MILLLASKFELEKKYSELEVNEVLNLHHSFEDPATLRRLLIGTSKLKRTKDGRATGEPILINSTSKNTLQVHD